MSRIRLINFDQDDEFSRKMLGRKDYVTIGGDKDAQSGVFAEIIQSDTLPFPRFVA